MSRILLVAALLAAPWPFGAVPPWAWASLAALVSAVLILWGIGSVRQGALKIYWSPLYWPALAFLLLGAIQYFAGLTPDHLSARESLLKVTTDLILFFLAGQLLGAGTGRRRILDGFGLAVTLFAFGLSLFAVIQFLTSHGRIYWIVKSAGWAFGPYVNHNHFAGLMEILIPISVGYLLSRPDHDPARMLFCFAILFQVISLLLSGSRGGLIALLAEALILGGILAGRNVGMDRRSLVATAGLGLGAAVLLFLWVDPGNISKRLSFVPRLGGASEAELGSRLVVARDTLHVLRDHPWLGAGLGSFEVVFPQYQSFPSDLRWEHAHNDYAEAVAETGLLGGALIVAAVVIFLRLMFRNLAERLREKAGWMQLGAALGCCGLLVHSFVDFNLHIPANAAWFAVCCGIAGRNILDQHEHQPGR